MRSHSLRLLRALVFAVLAALAVSASALAQSAVATSGLSAGAADLGELLRRGRQMEVESRWGEALTYYEDALHQFPGEGDLKSRFDYARLHYDLGRRYHDRSYRDLLGRLSLPEAINAYNEVLLKIQSHYVDMPHWKDLVAAGTNGFEVALLEPAFLQANAPKADGAMLDDFRRELRHALGARMIQNRADARDAVTAAASMAQERLGAPGGSVVLEYACAAASSLDPYSTYLTPDQLNEVYSQIEGNFVGLGVELKALDGALLIERVIPNSPAQRAGIRDGDRIIGVDGQATAAVSTDRAANLLQGLPGSIAQLVVLGPDGKTRELSVRRERVEVPSVDQVQILPGTQGIAYLKLTCFQKNTYHDLDAALWSLYRAGMRSLIMDLRRNPGGLLTAAVDAADLFIERGVIVSTHGRNAQEDATHYAREPGTWRVPLVVLIDQDSASAAEIFAGAIREHQRGTVVGKRSYGKGSVQAIFPLSTGSAGLRLTTAKFFSPTGRAYAGVGVEPNLVVHQAAKPVASDPSSGPQQDAFLAAGLQAAQQLTAQR